MGFSVYAEKRPARSAPFEDSNVLHAQSEESERVDLDKSWDGIVVILAMEGIADPMTMSPVSARATANLHRRLERISLESSLESQPFP